MRNNQNSITTIATVGVTTVFSVLFALFVNNKLPVFIITILLGHFWVCAGLFISQSITGKTFTRIFNDLTNDWDDAQFNRDYFKKVGRYLPKNKQHKTIAALGLTDHYKSFKDIYFKQTNSARYADKKLTCTFLIYSFIPIIIGLWCTFDDGLRKIQIDCSKMFLLQLLNVIAILLPLYVAYSVMKLDKKLPGVNYVANTFDKSVFVSTLFISIICIAYNIVSVLSAINAPVQNFNTYVNGFSTGAIAFQMIMANETFDNNLYKKVNMFDNYLKELEHESE